MQPTRLLVVLYDFLVAPSELHEPALLVCHGTRTGMRKESKVQKGSGLTLRFARAASATHDVQEKTQLPQFIGLEYRMALALAGGG